MVPYGLFLPSNCVSQGMKERVFFLYFNCFDTSSCRVGMDPYDIKYEYCTRTCKRYGPAAPHSKGGCAVTNINEVRRNITGRCLPQRHARARASHRIASHLFAVASSLFARGPLTEDGPIVDDFTYTLRVPFFSTFSLSRPP